MTRWFGKLDLGNGLRAMLFVQLGLAGLLIAGDAVKGFPKLFKDPVTLPTGPISPGDQKREYRTDRPNPGLLLEESPPDYALPEKFSDRLQFTSLSIDGVDDVLLVSGRIEAGDAARFFAFLKRLSTKPQMIALHSPGGVVAEALEIGRMLRQEDLPSAVLTGAYCLSSCPYILAGGTERTVSRRSVVGLHQHYYDQSKLLPAVFAVENIQISQGQTMEYLIEMDVDPSLMLYSLNTPPEEIYALVEDELIDTRIATRVND